MPNYLIISRLVDCPYIVLVYSLLLSQLDALDLAVGLAGVDLLAGLLDGAQHGLVGERGVCDDSGELRIEGDIVGLHTCFGGVCQLRVRGQREGRKGRDGPSSLPKTRFTAPEQPPQDMDTLNL